ncbi:hypothetical protein Nazgul11 [Burkholderia phage BcepNazgul]|uniref:Uncharacterized protein n=1 Tax=Burkholderia phage BcepNazgul TaxID=242861 RepID=Q6UYF4_9CAUD|nr:hypothetical protein Nazgul11 [Burkholderia phage BcepNazgul]AAQ63387.1 hypothetical protein Nazgul11 [Burkholderia phage BcepNazgul]
MKRLTSTLNHYYFNIEKPEEAQAYADMCAMLESRGESKWSVSVGLQYDRTKAQQQSFMGDMKAGDGQTIVFDTTHLFSDQWNTSDTEGGETLRGKRLFPWSEYEYPNKRIKEGYWFLVTDDMREALDHAVKCGYCGHQEDRAIGNAFCPSCYGSQYLKPDDLYLTRLLPVSSKAKRPTLSKAEREALMPRYVQAQLHGATERDKARIEKEKDRIEAKYVKTCAVALEKRDAGRWIMAHVPNLIDNWIFYAHTGRHCFGWRNPLSDEAVSLLLDVISEFPFNYEIKCANGGTLSN